MKHTVTLTITSLLSMLLTTFHHSDDVVRGMAPAGLNNLVPVVFLLVWLYGTLVLAERRSWTLIALSVTATFSVILSVRGLWSLRGQAR